MEVLLLAHGSKSPDYGAACAMFLERWEQYSGTHARLCFLEQCEPLLEDTLAEAAIRSRMLAVLPLLLNAGMHMRQDIPERLADFRQYHPEIELYLADGLTDVGVVAKALYDRATGIRADMPSIILLTHGSRRDDTRKDVECLAVMLALRASVEVDVVFSGYGNPSLKDVLAQRADKDAVVIVPHFLFPGIWQRQTRMDMDALRHVNSTMELTLAKPLGAHPALLRLLRRQLDAVLKKLHSEVP